MKPNRRLTQWMIGLQIAILLALCVDMGLAVSISRAGNASGQPFEQLAVTLLTVPSCPDCFDLSPLRDYFTQNGVKNEQIHSVAYNTFAGSVLMKKYHITQVPTAVIAGDVNKFDFMSGLIGSVGDIRDGAFVVTKLQPPYLDLKDNKVHGFFEMVSLTDNSCKDCYDVSLHDGVLERMAMKPSKKTTVDISSEEGKALVEQYVITEVPTILLRGELDPYAQLQEIWPHVGTKEDDGTYVLREGVTSMGVYKKLPSGEIVKPAPAPTTPPTNTATQ